MIKVAQVITVKLFLIVLENKDNILLGGGSNKMSTDPKRNDP